MCQFSAIPNFPYPNIASSKVGAIKNREDVLCHNIEEKCNGYGAFSLSWLYDGIMDKSYILYYINLLQDKYKKEDIYFVIYLLLLKQENKVFL